MRRAKLIGNNLFTYRVPNGTLGFVDSVYGAYYFSTNRDFTNSFEIDYFDFEYV